MIIIDELPYLVDGRRELEAQLQHVWDQILEHPPVLLIAIGSDLAMMAAFDQPRQAAVRGGRPARSF